MNGLPIIRLRFGVVSQSTTFLVVDDTTDLFLVAPKPNPPNPPNQLATTSIASVVADRSAGDTVTKKQYAPRGEYDPRSLDSVLQWVNARRAAKGVSLIGAPLKNAPDGVTTAFGM